MLKDKRIKSCLSRFDSGAYSRVQSAILSALIRSPYSRGTTAAATAARTKTRTGRRPCQQRRLQRCRNRQRQPQQQPRTTLAKCASWRHVLASHWWRADMRGSVKRVLCLSCGYYHGNAYFFLDDRLCRSNVAIFVLIIATFAYYKVYLCYYRWLLMINIWLCYVAMMSRIRVHLMRYFLRFIKT